MSTSFEAAATAPGTTPGPVPDAVPARSPGLKSRAARAAVLTITAAGVMNVIRLGGNVCLTRLLTPDAFGFMSLVGAMMAGLQMFSDIGIGPSLIQHDREDEEFVNTAWTMQVFRGVTLWVCACILAWPVAAFYHESELIYLIPVVGFCAVLGGLESTALFTAQRKIALFRFLVVEVGSYAVSVVVMVAWALVWHTVWALVAGGLTQAALKTILSRVLFPDVRNRFCWNREAYIGLLHFGKWIFLSTMMTFLSMQGDRLLLGKFATITELGIYSIAISLAQAPRRIFDRLANQIVFPAISHVVRGGASVHAQADRARRTLIRLMAPPLALLIGAGPPLIHLLYDSRYQDAGLFLTVFAAGVWFQVIAASYGCVFFAVGQPRLVTAATLTKAAVYLIFFIPAYHMGGIFGAVVLSAITDVVTLLVCFAGAVFVGFSTLSGDVIDSVLAAAMAGLIWGTCTLAQAQTGTRWAGVLVSCVLTAGVGLLLVRSVMRARREPATAGAGA